ncbi:DUF3631 domain-containing protein [Ferriphaselus sp. R-1]|uniref:DUF3631 domain-containing protein n=1 Tax=Ferriphaselus sp. R-1 TaxID=1485544 RepID=UPI000690F848|nr:DUF3631 domain-containing protein [Ferriphaselus sp. R-1]
MAIKASSGGELFPPVSPFPDPINLAELLDEVSKLIRRYIVLTPHQADAVSLWIALTWGIDSVQIAALLLINAPEKSCGKSQLLELVGRMSARQLSVSNITLAGLFRVIEKYSPTLLIDEADTFFREKNELTGLINAGHSRSAAYVLRIVGENHEPMRFSVWGAKAIAGIGLERHLPSATMSRGIQINLRRKTLEERVERLRHADAGLFGHIASKLARFAVDFCDAIRTARPPVPDALGDRDQDNWEPLLAIAELAGHGWLERATAAALALSNLNEPSTSFGNELLGDIRDVFQGKRVGRITTAEMIGGLIEDDERPWATYNYGKPITPRQLAKLLSPYGIKSKTVRQGPYSTPKGFELTQFEDAFDRYLTSPKTPEEIPDTSATYDEEAPDDGLTPFQRTWVNGLPPGRTEADF